MGRARGCIILLGALTGIPLSSLAHAQAWVPDLGDATIAVSTQYARVMKHLLSVGVDGIVEPVGGYQLGPGNQAHLGDLVIVSTTLSGEYVPVKRFAVTGEINYAGSRYKGRMSESTFDDGAFHADIQDMMLGARYMLPTRKLAITPSLDVRLPVTSYNTAGHVASGTGLRSLTLGLNLGRSLDPFAAAAYGFVNYARVIVENADGFSLDRNQISCGLGMFFTRSLSAQAHFQYTDTVDGLDWWWASPSQLHHRYLDAKALARRVGLSGGYTLTRHAGLALSWESTLSGANVHATHSVTLGASWSFWRRRPA